MILALCDEDGLIVGDEDTGLTAYAFPYSYPHYVSTTRPSMLESIAREMLLEELSSLGSRDPSTPLGLRLREQDREWLSQLKENPLTRRFEVCCGESR